MNSRLYYEGEPTVVEEGAVLEEGTAFGNHLYCIASLGRYPVAYVTCTRKELEAAKRMEGKAPCHGGITFSAEPGSEPMPPALRERPNNPDPFVGWDYGYASDYKADDGDVYGDRTHGKIWTVEEIREEVYAVAKWLEGLTVDGESTVDEKPTVDKGLTVDGLKNELYANGEPIGETLRRLEAALGCPISALPIGDKPTVAINYHPGAKHPLLGTVEVVKVVLVDGCRRPYFEYRYKTVYGLELTGRALLSAYGWDWAESAETWEKARAWRLRGEAFPQ